MAEDFAEKSIPHFIVLDEGSCKRVGFSESLSECQIGVRFHIYPNSESGVTLVWVKHDITLRGPGDSSSSDLIDAIQVLQSHAVGFSWEPSDEGDILRLGELARAAVHLSIREYTASVCTAMGEVAPLIPMTPVGMEPAVYEGRGSDPSLSNL